MQGRFAAWFIIVRAKKQASRVLLLLLASFSANMIHLSIHLSLVVASRPAVAVIQACVCSTIHDLDPKYLDLASPEESFLHYFGGDHTAPRNTLRLTACGRC